MEPALLSQTVVLLPNKEWIFNSDPAQLQPLLADGLTVSGIDVLGGAHFISMRDQIGMVSRRDRLEFVEKSGDPNHRDQLAKWVHRLLPTVSGELLTLGISYEFERVVASTAGAVIVDQTLKSERLTELGTVVSGSLSVVLVGRPGTMYVVSLEPRFQDFTSNKIYIKFAVEMRSTDPSILLAIPPEVELAARIEQYFPEALRTIARVLGASNESPVN